VSAAALDVSIAPELTGRVRLGVLVLEGMTVGEADEALAAEIDAHGRELRERYAQAKSAEVPGTRFPSGGLLLPATADSIRASRFEDAWAAARTQIEDARTLYKALGLDPTKTRPANEALLRRVLKGEALYRVNTLVDALNLCSLRFQLPFGLYDLDRVVPPVVLRRGMAGEAYDGIRKAQVNVEGRPVLSDAQGPFGNPTSDSARTMITPGTVRALVTVYVPIGFALGRLDKVLDGTETTLTRACGGSRMLRQILPPA
jgi:DNA/RNA-binding domain of Phe-tRNA-synthetase-like protein